MNYFVLCTFFFLLFGVNYVSCDNDNGGELSIKIIDENPKEGFGLSGNEQTHTLRMRMKPAEVSGPEHLAILNGQCFTYTTDKYDYEFCPFHNLTQKETQVIYEPFFGILGVWGEWEIDNNTFIGMNMIEGSACGLGKFRSTLVKLECGQKTALKKVEEPHRCVYSALFTTPLVCPKNALVVYPRLPPHLRAVWDAAYTEFKQQLTTEQGYKKKLLKIFADAGLRISQEDKEALFKRAEKERLEYTGRQQEGETVSCQEELEALRNRVLELEMLLQEAEGQMATTPLI